MRSKQTLKMANKTLHTKKQLIEALTKSLGIVTTACKQVGVSRTTFYEYMKDPDFKKEVDDIAGVALDFAESQLHKQILANSTAATIFYLKTKGKKRGYIERQEVEHSGTVEQITGVQIVKDDDDTQT